MQLHSGEEAHEIAGAGRRDRWRRRRRLDALSPRQEGLVGRRAGRAQGADLRLDLACGRPAAALQHELLGRPDPQILGRALQDAGGGDRPKCRLLRLLQHPPRPHQGPLGRIHVLCRRGPHDRRQRQCADAGAGEGDLAALRNRRHARRYPASRRRLYPARRSDAGAGARRAQQRRRDLPQHRSHRHRTDALRRMAGEDRQGRHRLRARRLRDRQLRPPHRRNGRPRRAGHPGRAPVYRDRGASRHPGAQRQGASRNGRAARGGFLLVHARGSGRPAARSLREGRAGLLRRRTFGGQRIRAVPGGSRAPDAAYRDGHRARAGLRRGRHQEGL